MNYAQRFLSHLKGRPTLLADDPVNIGHENKFTFPGDAHPTGSPLEEVATLLSGYEQIKEWNKKHAHQLTRSVYTAQVTLRAKIVYEMDANDLDLRLRLDFGMQFRAAMEQLIADRLQLGTGHECSAGDAVYLINPRDVAAWSALPGYQAAYRPGIPDRYGSLPVHVINTPRPLLVEPKTAVAMAILPPRVEVELDKDNQLFHYYLSREFYHCTNLQKAFPCSQR